MREQYFFYRGRVQEAKRDLMTAERQLRQLIGIAPADGRIIRPSDDTTFEETTFQWKRLHKKALSESPEVKSRRSRIGSLTKQLEAAQRKAEASHPEAYKTLGFLDVADDSLSISQMGIKITMPIGLRRMLSSIRHLQLSLARERGDS